MKSFCLTLSAFFVALGTLTAGLFYIPVGVSKCFPMQSLINCLAGVLIGPKKAAIVAFLIALLRNLLGTGSLLAFPGSIVGAYLAGMFFTRTKKEGASLLGEMIGTGLVAAHRLVHEYLPHGKDRTLLLFCHSLWHECLRRCPASGTHHEVTPDDGRKKKIRKMSLGPRITTRTSGCRSFLLMKP